MDEGQRSTLNKPTKQGSNPVQDASSFPTRESTLLSSLAGTARAPRRRRSLELQP